MGRRDAQRERKEEMRVQEVSLLLWVERGKIIGKVDVGKLSKMFPDSWKRCKNSK